MLDFGGMFIIIGGFVLAITIVMGMCECVERNKQINRRIERLEKELYMTQKRL